MIKKNLFLTALLCLVAWCNAWADTATLNQSSDGSFTDDPAEGGVTFSITNLGNWTNATGSSSFTQNKHAAGYEVAANTYSVITWSGIPSGYNFNITKVEVIASCAEKGWTAKGFDVYTSVSGDGQKETVSGGGNTTKTITLTGDTYLKNIGANGSITIAHGDTKMYINSVVIEYTLEAEPFIEIEDANITNQWNCNLAANEYKCAAYNTTGFSVGASSDAEVARYDAANSVFVLGHKTGVASFTVSADGVEDRTFTITANQGFYGYAANIAGEAALAETHNQGEAESVISTFRANKIASVSNGDDVTYMLDNPDFEYSTDWDYGWAGTTDDNKNGDGDAMLAFQKNEDNTTYAWNNRTNSGLSQRTLNACDIYQQNDIALPAGYYVLGAKVEVSSNDNNGGPSATLYAKVGEDIKGSLVKNSVRNGSWEDASARFYLEDASSVRIGLSNNEVKNTSRKTVKVDNFALTYICSKEIYDAYMEQYNRAEGLKDDARLQTATKEALNAAFVDINTLADAAAIEAQTTTLKDACDAGEADIAWAAGNAAIVNINNVLVYAGANKELSRGADWGTRAIVTEDGLTVNVTTAANGIANLTFTDSNKMLFETTDHYIYTDYNNNGSYDFYLVGDEEDGYKIVLAGDRTKALGIVENEEWEAGSLADVVMTVAVAEATVWHFAADKSMLSVKAERYGTFCAPYEVTLPEGVTGYSATIDGMAVILTELQDKNVVPANTPVIVKNDNEEAVTAYYYGEAATETTVTAGPLVGVFVSMPVPVGTYVMQIHDDVQNFYIVAEGQQPTIAKNKAYIQTDIEARILTLGTDEETAIEAIEALVSNKAQIFDLNGRRLSGLQKGINIINGKKVLVK